MQPEEPEKREMQPSLEIQLSEVLEVQLSPEVQPLAPEVQPLAPEVQPLASKEPQPEVPEEPQLSPLASEEQPSLPRLMYIYQNVKMLL
jgi:hypothetical protein